MVYHVVRGRKRQLLTRVLRAFVAAVESGLARLLPWVPRSSVQGELPRLGFPTRANFRLDDLFRRLQSSAHDLGTIALRNYSKNCRAAPQLRSTKTTTAALHRLRKDFTENCVWRNLVPRRGALSCCRSVIGSRHVRLRPIRLSVRRLGLRHALRPSCAWPESRLNPLRRLPLEVGTCGHYRKLVGHYKDTR